MKWDGGSDFHFSVFLKRSHSGNDDTDFFNLDLKKTVRALIVDNNAESRDILTGLWEYWGLNCERAATDQDAADLMALALSQGRPYKLVLVDATHADWHESLWMKRMKDNTGPADLKIIVLAPVSRAADEAWMAHPQVAGVLSKPPRMNDLKQLTAQALGIKGAKHERVPAAVESSRVLENIRVLLAEDNELNQEVAVSLLEAEGCQVTVACNGKVALDMLQSQVFDLVFMDVQMPVMDGFETTKHIRAGGDPYAGIPIIAMTAHAMKGDREKCLNAGMNEYIAKPIDVNELQSVLYDWGGKIHSSKHESASSVKRAGVVNRNKALGRINDNVSLYSKMCEIFMLETPQLYSDLDCSLKEADSKKAERFAHSIKGSAAAIGADELMNLALNMEMLARDHEMDEAGRRIGALKKQLDEVLAELSQE